MWSLPRRAHGRRALDVPTERRDAAHLCAARMVNVVHKNAAAYGLLFLGSALGFGFGYPFTTAEKILLTLLSEAWQVERATFLATGP